MATSTTYRARKINLPRAKTPTTKITPAGKLWAKIIGVVLLFLIGVGMGHNQGLKDAGHTPDSTTVAVLHYAESHSKTPCWAEWRAGQHDFEVICAKA